MTKSAFQFATKVGPGGKPEINVPLPLGTNVEVLVLAPETREFVDLVAAAFTSTDFWDNPLDDEDWNNA
jgi:hypothetical protein